MVGQETGVSCTLDSKALDIKRPQFGDIFLLVRQMRTQSAFSFVCRVLVMWMFEA